MAIMDFTKLLSLKFDERFNVVILSDIYHRYSLDKMKAYILSAEQQEITKEMVYGRFKWYVYNPSLVEPIEEKNDSARKVIERSMELFPDERIPYGYFSVQIPEVFYRLGNIEEANKITKEIADMYISELGYYFSLEMKFSKTLQSEKQLGLQILQELIRLTGLYQQDELNDQLKEKFNAFYVLYREGA